MNLSKLLFKKINHTKYLEKHYGGKWKYDGCTTWWCNDGIRHVSRTSSCSHDYNCNCPPQYWMYGNKTPEIIYWDEYWDKGKK